MNAPQLIDFALDQIETEMHEKQLLLGRPSGLSDLEKGRIIVDFLKKKNKPFENRFFYNHFYQEHDKAEKLEVLEQFTEKIQEVIKEKEGE